MELELNSIGGFAGRPAKIIELTVSGSGSQILEDITDLNSFVDYNFIANLREIADELEDHNQKLANQTNF